MQMFFAEVIETLFLGGWVLRCSLTCLSIRIWSFFAQMWYKNYDLSDVKLHLFSVSVEKSESLFIHCSRDRCRRGTLSGPMQCTDMELLSLLIQFFELYASSVNCTRHIALKGSRAQLCVISSSSSILVTLCFRRFCFGHFSRVSLTC